MTNKETAIQAIKYKIKKSFEKNVSHYENKKFRYLLVNVVTTGRRGVEEHPIYVPFAIFKNKKFLTRHVLDYHFTSIAERMIETKTFIKSVDLSTYELSLVQDE